MQTMGKVKKMEEKKDICFPDIDESYKYHAVTDNQAYIIEEFRDRGKNLAYRIKECVPSCREQSLALTKLEECIMWVNKAISIHGLNK